MTSEFRSYAKVNLHLQVVGRRPDGYHELRTLFQTIDLHDRLVVEPGGQGVTLDVSAQDSSIPGGPSNLAFQAASAFLSEWGGASGARLQLRKQIPSGGGLGGGSSNAATVLLALRDQLGVPETVGELWPVARRLGADVPFFLIGGTALGFGRGDELVSLDDLIPAQLCLVLVPVHASTEQVFGAMGRLTESPLTPSIMGLLERGRPRSLEEVTGHNDLAETARELFPAIHEVFASLSDEGVEAVSLSGSGSTLFLYGSSVKEASKLEPKLPAGVTLVKAETLSRANFLAGRLFREGRAADEHY